MRQMTVTVLAFLVGCTTADKYRSSGRSEDLRGALNQEVTDGASIGRVQQLLGPGWEVRDDEQRRLVLVTRQIASRTNTYPAGTQDDDRFVGYPSKDGGTLYLQFRNGKLINFNPDDFARADALRVGVSGGGRAN